MPIGPATFALVPTDNAVWDLTTYLFHLGILPLLAIVGKVGNSCHAIRFGRFSATYYSSTINFPFIRP